MKKKLQEAVSSGDMPKVREMLIQMIYSGSDKPCVIEDITEVISNAEGLFEPDNGGDYPEKGADLTQAQVKSLKQDIKRNFSLKKFRLLADVQEILKENPSYYESREKPLRDTIEQCAQQGDIDRQIDAEQREDRHHPGRKAARITGYVIMILGLAASIVGVCVPVTFLIGVGIGVLMLGAAVSYASLPRH